MEKQILAVEKRDMEERIFGILEGKKAEISVYRGLLQGMHDMAFSGEHGSTFTKVLQSWFPKKSEVLEDLSPYIEEVFCKEQYRFPEGKIFYICKSKDLDETKESCFPDKLQGPLFNYHFIGKDHFSEEGFFYFGEKAKYVIRFGKYILSYNASFRRDALAMLSIPCTLFKYKDFYSVETPPFYERAAAEHFALKIKKDYGVSNMEIVPVFRS